MQQAGAGSPQQPLEVGVKVEVWWPRYNKSFGAQIVDMSETSIELLYDDGGERKSYVPNEIIPRIAIAEVCRVSNIQRLCVTMYFCLSSIVSPIEN